jgi:hypothetical protein
MSWADFVAEANGFSVFSSAAEEAVVTAVQRVAHDSGFGVALLPPVDESDGALVLSLGSDELRLPWMTWSGPGSPLSKTILGATNWVRGTAGSADDRARVTALLYDKNVLIGCVAQPAIQSELDVRFEALVSITATLCGVLFNGWAFADASGAVLVHA